MSNGLHRLGIPGVIGLGLLFFCLAFATSTILPARQRLKEAEQTLAHYVARTPAATVVSQEVAPAALTLTHLVESLDATAQKQGIVPTQIAYRAIDDDTSPRLEISQPLRASYPALRAYLHNALLMAPTARLEKLSMQRALATDVMVEANLVMSFPVAP